MFEGKVFSQVSSQFVCPLFPACGEEVSISVLVDPAIEVEESFCVTNFNGTQWRFSPTGRDEDGFIHFTVKGAWKPEVLRYYFVLRLSGRYHYYSKEGLKLYPPQAKNHFTLIPGLDSPQWIASSTCYQIFPDRFANGDVTNDVHDGDYIYDGYPVTAHSFDEVPRPYDQAHCLDFFNGDLKGVEDHLDHLQSLGVDCIYLNPIGCSRTMHRFDAEDYFHVDGKLGGDEALISLIAACHERGIRVVVDISINHTSPQNAWFVKAMADPGSKERGYYYITEDGDYAKWAGVATMPQLNFNSQALRDELYRSPDSAMQKFLRPPFDQDGWRLDVAPELGRHGSDQLCKEVWREVRRHLKAVKNDIYLVGEDWNDASEYLEGDMWDATMDYYGSGRPLRSWMGERDRFLTGGWGHDPQADNEYDAYTLAEALQSSMDASRDQMRFFRMNLFDSHDTPRLHNDLKVYRQKRYEGVVMALCLLPGMPNIYYGDEVGLDGRMGSVEASRYPMQWDERKWNRATLRVHQLMGQVRKDASLAFASTCFFPIDAEALAIVRMTGDRAWLLILNKGGRRTVHLDALLLKGFSVAHCLYGALDSLDSIHLEEDESILAILKR